MIFVTVGTSYSFDQLVREIDNIASELDDKVIIQIGRSNYEPRNCEWFRFRPSLAEYIEKADIVISHGGAGTTFEVLTLGKKLVSVENANFNSHQWDLLDELSKERYCLYCKHLDDLYSSIQKAREFRFSNYEKPECNIHKKIIQFIG